MPELSVTYRGNPLHRADLFLLVEKGEEKVEAAVALVDDEAELDGEEVLDVPASQFGDPWRVRRRRPRATGPSGAAMGSSAREPEPCQRCILRAPRYCPARKAQE